ncbi:MAG: FtsW/RodA/SpoVE family cell cycle protein [Candidatus Promineifilaceae bacterium]|jgi:cell division protein FtsW
MTTVNVVKKRGIRVHPRLMFHIDYWMLLAFAGLVIIGLLTVYSTTFDLGRQWHDGDAGYFVRRQLFALVLGLAGFVAVFIFDYHLLRKLSIVIFIIAILGLIATLLVGVESLGAKRGLMGGSIQPSELAKLATIIYIAHWLSSKGDRIKGVTYGLIPFSIIVGVVCGLIVRQPDLSTAVLIAAVSFTLFFIAGADLKQFVLAIVIGGAVFAMLVFVFPHAQARVEAYRIALENPMAAGYQVEQTLAAVANGGIWGVGPGASTQKFIPLPAAHTDGAFAILAEEYGLVGALSTMSLMAILVWRGLKTAGSARDGYGFLLAVGITCWLGFQTLLNIAVITAVIPVTGIPLPFISYGGSAFAMSIVGAGVLLNVSRDSSIMIRPQPKPSSSR